jgi:hypothetical protein
VARAGGSNIFISSITLAGLGLVATGVILSVILRPVYNDKSSRNSNGIRNSRQAARLHGQVQEVSVEEYSVGADGKPDVLHRSERSWYDNGGDRVRYVRNSVNQDESKSGAIESGEASTQLDTGISLNEFGFRLVSPNQIVLNPTRVRYAFEIFNLHRFEAFYFNEDGDSRGKSVHQDFTEGKRRYVSIIQYSPEGNRERSELTVLNQRGDIEEQIQRNHDGNIVLHWVYSYDRRGNLIEMTSLDNDGKPRRKVTFGYVYDEMGNWIERTTYSYVVETGVESTFFPKIITKRKITYHSGR